MDIISFSKHILDHRIVRRKEHSVETIVYIAMAAVICGAESWGEIGAFGICKKDLFARQIPSFNGIPSHDTFNRFFSSIDPAYFEREFRFWVRELCGKYEGVVAIDGKTIRGASRGDDKTPLEADRKSRFKLHMVSAWAADNGISLGQVRVNEKSNEITAIPELIKALDLVNCIITIDAMACDVKNADLITSKEGHYILALKKNNKHIYQQVSERFAQIKPKLIKNEHIDFGSGRIETRTCYVENNLILYDDLSHWKHLKSIIIIESKREIKGKISVETRFYLSDLALEPKDFNQYIRNHWSIENRLHWQLDVTFREDLQRTKTGNAPENLAIIRKLSLQLLNKVSDKESIKSRRKIAGWNNQYLIELLNNI